MIRVGWTTHYLPAGIAVGSNDNSYAFDGYAVRSFPLHCEVTYICKNVVRPASGM